MTIKTEVANHPQKGKRLVESKSEITIMMLPSEANSSVCFWWRDIEACSLTAGLVAKRHTGHANVVTASSSWG